MRKYLIQRREGNVFVTLWQGTRNPFMGMSEEEIADALLANFGRGWYQVFRFESLGYEKWDRNTIFKGVV